MLYVILSSRMAAKQIQFMMICMFNIAPAIRRPQMPLMPIMPVFLFLLWSQLSRIRQTARSEPYFSPAKLKIVSYLKIEQN